MDEIQIHVSEEGAKALEKVVKRSPLEVKAEAFARSGMFKNVSSFAMAFAKIEIGRDLGISAAAALKGIHLIPQKGGGVMPEYDGTLLRALIRKYDGYDYKIPELTDEAATIVLVNDKTGEELARERFTKEHAIRAGVWGKDNYEHYPRNMLINRATANLVRWYCPEVTHGPAYVLGETGGVFGGEMEECDYEVVENLIKPVERPDIFTAVLNKGKLYLNEATLDHLRLRYASRDLSDGDFAGEVVSALVGGGATVEKIPDLGKLAELYSITM